MEGLNWTGWRDDCIYSAIHRSPIVSDKWSGLKGIQKAIWLAGWRWMDHRMVICVDSHREIENGNYFKGKSIELPSNYESF